MQTILSIVFLLNFLAVFYAYFGYPLILRYLVEIKTPRPLPQNDVDLPSLGIIITVRNEAAVIEEKIEATLALSYAEKTVEQHLASDSALIELLIASDASDDDTDEIVRSFESRGVRLVRLPERGGKETAQRAAVAELNTELIVFSDAKIQLAGDVLERFAYYFLDPEVGAVSSTDNVVSDDGESSGEGFYVRYEMWLRELESEFNSLVGLSGSCFAVRAKLAENLATDIPSDFALLIEAQKNGFRGVHAPDVIASYKAVRTEKEEFKRKVRTVLRGITTFFARSEVMDVGTYGVFAWQIVSHKLMRWLVPWCSLIAVLCAFILSAQSLIFHWICLAIISFCVLAAVGFVSAAARTNKYFKIPLFFIVTNAAIAVSWIKFWSGTRTVIWDPSAKGKSA